MAAASGKVALVNSTTALNCGATATTCTSAQLALIVDAVAFGSQTGSYTGEGGTQAIEALLPELDSGRLQLTRGCLTLVPVTNPLAYRQGTRQGERNLNRRLRPEPDPREFEDRIANVLCPLLAAHDVLLDLHSL